MWILAAALSALFAGLTSVLAKCGIKKTDSDLATAVRTFVVLIFFVVDGFHRRLCGNDNANQRKIAVVSHFIGFCDGRVVDMLFQGLVNGRCKQSRTY